MPQLISPNYVIPKQVLSEMQRTGANRLQRIERGFIYQPFIDKNGLLHHQQIAFSPQLFNQSQAQIHNHNQFGYLTSITSLNTGNQILQSSPTVPIIDDLNPFIQLAQVNPYNSGPTIYNFNNGFHIFHPSNYPTQPLYQQVLGINRSKYNINLWSQQVSLFL